ncbi:MAG: sucrose synthase, partial [Pseudomonadota bacterium]
MNTKNTKKLISVLQDYLHAQRSHAHKIVHHFASTEKRLFLRSDLLDGFTELCRADQQACLRETPLAEVISHSQEAAVNANWIYFAVRKRIGSWFYLRIHLHTLDTEEVPVSQFLHFKERLAQDGESQDEWLLEIDLEPFTREFDKPSESRSIGRGVEFLNRRLSSRL